MKNSKRTGFISTSALVLSAFYLLNLANPVDITQSQLLLTVQTDKPLYMQGEAVKIFGTVKDSSSQQPVSQAAVGIEVRDPRNNTIFLDIVFSLANGTYEDNFRLRQDTQVGIYNTYTTASAPGYPTAMNQTSFTVTAGVHDVAVIDGKPWKTIVGQGLPVKVNVTLQNQGDFTESFDVNVYADLTMPIGDELTIATKTVVNLQAKENRTVLTTWNTTETTVKGIYTLSAVADSVQGEADMIDNTFIDGSIQVAMVGDVYGRSGAPDGKVDVRDIAVVAKAYGSYSGHPRYVANYDINSDDQIDIRDIAIVAIRFGQVDP